jgi:FkbM family methyltransferase
MMQKDERYLLKPWLSYYGYLFGYENLFVVDNGSQLPEVCNVLKEYQIRGVNVDYRYGDRKHYEAKGEIISEQMRQLDCLGQYDFLIPLDCDEFIVMKIDGGFFPSADHILHYLNGLKGENRVLRFPHQLANHPLYPFFFHYFDFYKVFFAANTFVSVDHGNHTGRSRGDAGVRDTDLIHLHFHHKKYDVLIEQAKRSWIGAVDIDNREQLEGYHGPSMHLAQHFLASQETYYAGFLDKVHFYLPQLMILLQLLGAPLKLPTEPVSERLRVRIDADSLPFAMGRGAKLAPFLGGKTVALVPEDRPSGIWFKPTEFNEKDYLEANDDLVKADVHGLSHYCYYGFRERRLLSRRLAEKPSGAGCIEKQAEHDHVGSCIGYVKYIDQRVIFVDTENYSPTMLHALESGNYEESERNVVPAVVQSTDRVLEIGTAIGVVTMTLAAIVGPSNVMTYDANPAMVSDARRNFAANAMRDISANVGVMRNRSRWSTTESEIDFFVSRDFWASRLAADQQSPDISSVLRVPLVCLESQITEHRANVLVCDIEGGEADLLNGADLSSIRLILLEIHPWAVGRRRIDDMIQFLILSGFNVDFSHSSGTIVVLDRSV